MNKMNDQEFLARVGETVNGLEDLHNRNFLKTPRFYKMLVAIAYEYFLRDFPEQGEKLLARIPRSYYSTEFRNQLVEDKEFAEVAAGFSRILIEAGLAETGQAMGVPVARA